jgi:phage/plasmid primase-like uncharacterized protein
MNVRDDWIDRARAEKTETVLRERLIFLTLKGSNGTLAGPCPICGGKDRFAVSLRKGNGGVFHCRGCGASGGDAISMICFLDGCSFLQAVETLVGPPPDHRETDEERRAREQRAIECRQQLELLECERRVRDATELHKKILSCDRLWTQAVPPTREAIAYFEKRGIPLGDVPNQGGLRFLPRCPFDGEVRPCVVGRLTDVISGAPGGIWRRPVTGEKPKTFGPLKGHCIRLWPDEDVTQGLVIGEGVETILAAAINKMHRNTLLQPAWACGCDDNLRNFPVLPGIEHLTILADNDQSGAGQAAARACAERWAAADRQVEVLAPDIVGEDFNDIVLRSA